MSDPRIPRKVMKAMRAESRRDLWLRKPRNLRFLRRAHRHLFSQFRGADALATLLGDTK